MNTIGIAGLGIYVPDGRMTAKDISEKTKGQWAEEAIIEKLGIIEKPIPGEEDGTQSMAVRASLKAIDDAGIDAKDIDLILCMGEEWKEYPLTTSALYIQGEIGADNAWGIDVQNRCSTTLSAMKIAKDMMTADDHINTVLIAGGYRNGDFLNYKDSNTSMMFNLSAGGGAMILKKGLGKNLLLGNYIMADGSMARDAGVEFGGHVKPINSENAEEAYQSLRLFRPKEMKDRLNEVSLNNWLTCIDGALDQSGMTRKDIDYVGILHIKRSMHDFMLEELGVTADQSIYLEHYGHMGQVDQILSLKLALDEGKVRDGSNILLIAAGIGYVWGASVVRWGGV